MSNDETNPARVRPAVAGDAAAVRDLVRAAYAHFVPRLGREPGPMTDDYARRIADHEVWVLEARSELAGVLVLTQRPTSFLLQNIAVAPAAQGKGYGRQLLAFAEGMATALGYAELQLYTNVKMVENLAMYAHLGFREIGRIHEAGFDRVYMAKPLTSRPADAVAG